MNRAGTRDERPGTRDQKSRDQGIGTTAEEPGLEAIKQRFIAASDADGEKGHSAFGFGFGYYGVEVL
jgi:hypothetical protein